MVMLSVPVPSGFAYFEAPVATPPTGWTRAPTGKPIQGMFPPEAFALPLPAGAIPKGQGKDALGIVARSGGTLGAADSVPGPWPRYLTLLGAVGLGWVLAKWSGK